MSARDFEAERLARNAREAAPACIFILRAAIANAEGAA